MMNSIMIVPAKLLFLLLVGTPLRFGLALECTTCQSEISWEDCRNSSSVAACSTDEVNESHAVTSLGNPTLTQGGSLEDGFKCFAVHVRSKNSGGTTGSPDLFSKGCTFAKTDFCNGWISSLVVVKCGVDEGGDVMFGGVRRTGAIGLVAMISVGLCTRMIW